MTVSRFFRTNHTPLYAETDEQVKAK